MTDKKALHITKEARDTIFIDCDIQGVQNDGFGTKMIRTKRHNFLKEISITLPFYVIALCIAYLIVFFITL